MSKKLAPFSGGVLACQFSPSRPINFSAAHQSTTTCRRTTDCSFLPFVHPLSRRAFLLALYASLPRRSLAKSRREGAGREAVGKARRKENDYQSFAMSLSTIISGGQTGADSAALDFAIEKGIPHGGWCPKGRKAEDGPIPARYALQETPRGRLPTAYRVERHGQRRHRDHHHRIGIDRRLEAHGGLREKAWQAVVAFEQRGLRATIGGVHRQAQHSGAERGGDAGARSSRLSENLYMPYSPGSPSKTSRQKLWGLAAEVVATPSATTTCRR